MYRPAPLLAALIAGIGGLGLLHAPLARPATGGCSVASAPLITSHATQTSNPSACPDGLQYWAMKLRIGDALNVDIAPKPPPGGGLVHYELHVYGPNVGTIGSPLCGNAYSSPTRESCLIPAAGRYVLVTEGAGSFTPVAKSVPAQAGRVAGTCDPANAPAAASAVTEYANTRLCQPSGNSEYWRIDLRRGDTLNVNILPIGGSIFVHVYGPTVGTVGNPLCGNGYSSATTLSCTIQRRGRYVLGVENAGAFTPLVVHPTSLVLSAPRSARAGAAFTVSVTIRSNAPHAVGTCVVEESSGSRWSVVARARTTTGKCRVRVVLNRRGTVHLRVRFKGARGWRSNRSKPITVVVQ